MYSPARQWAGGRQVGRACLAGWHQTRSPGRVCPTSATAAPGAVAFALGRVPREGTLGYVASLVRGSAHRYSSTTLLNPSANKLSCTGPFSVLTARPRDSQDARPTATIPVTETEAECSRRPSSSEPRHGASGDDDDDGPTHTGETLGPRRQASRERGARFQEPLRGAIY